VYKTALFIIGIIGILVCSCTAPNNDEYDPDKSKTNRFKGNPLLKPYFYPLESVPKIYIYRDKINGLLEQFHRVYTLTDNEGEHLIVERYNMKGELYEALNINTDSLNVMDHMIVNQKGEKTKAILYKGGFFPSQRKASSGVQKRMDMERYDVCSPHGKTYPFKIECVNGSSWQENTKHAFSRRYGIYLP